MTVAVGRITKVWRDGNVIRGEGTFDTHPDAVEAQRRMGAGMLNGVSINADDISNSEVEYVWPEGDGEGEDGGDILQMLFGAPEKIIFHSARLRAATLCDIPAFVEAKLFAVDPDSEEVATSSHQPPNPRVVSVHESVLSDAAWDAPEHEARLRQSMPLELARAAYAHITEQGDVVGKTACRFLHHEVGDDGQPHAANISACLAGIQAVHGSRIPAEDKGAVYAHLAAHLRDAGIEPPPYEPEFALVAHAWQDEAWKPPAAWFRDPSIVVPTPIMVTDAGQVYGLATEWSQCHIGFGNECVLPPKESYHSYFLTGELGLDDGSSIAVGQITAGIGHAPLTMSAQRASEHYDNTDAVVADVTVGNCRLGIWVAGAIRPSAQAARVQALRASGQVSPDWRKIGGQMRMVGLLTVNVSGYQVPRVRTYSEHGQMKAMVASGMVSVHLPGPSPEDLDRRALQLMREQLRRMVHPEIK